MATDVPDIGTLHLLATGALKLRQSGQKLNAQIVTNVCIWLFVSAILNLRR